MTLLLAGCGGAPKAITPELTGCGSDEQWVTFDDKEPTATVSDAQAPQFTAPNLSTTVAFSPKPIFSWNQDAADPGKSDGDVIYMDGPGCMGCCPEFNIGSLAGLHLPAISGDEYDLQFFDGGTLTYRLITTLQEWTPPDDVWTSWKGKTLTIKIYRMAVITNDVKSGPFVGSAPATLRVGS